MLRDLGKAQPDLIGHRFVHGGEISDAARLIDASEQKRLAGISYLAPLHMPSNLLGVDLCATRFDCPQIACFDTAFHATLPELAYRLPIPQALKLRRYGFHGINYAYVAQQLPAFLGKAAQGRIVVAHLGNGVSLCLLENLHSIDTSMGYSAAGGIPMATRSGDLDPGVMLELAKRYDETELSELVYPVSYTHLSETGPLATSWHSNKFLNPIRDGAVLPILHLNGYKINNPTILSRISHEELENLFKGYGWKPYFVEGDDPKTMHQTMATILEMCVTEIQQIQKEARDSGKATRPRWPMIVLRSPKGWTGPKEVDGLKVEGFWRAHQVPLGKVKENPEHLKQLESWLRSYKPQELFDGNGPVSYTHLDVYKRQLLA